MGTSVATLKISEELKRRVAVAAKAADKSPHAFMLEAIERQTQLNEERRTLIAEAVAARDEALLSGQGYVAQDVHRYLGTRVRGQKAPRPKAHAWHK